MTASEITILVAVGAGVISFLSPCVLPLVPAYLGQLTAIAVAGQAGGRASRWTAIRHALAFVAGFGFVFTMLGVTATYAASGLAAYMDTLRTVGGALLVVLGLSLAGLVRIPVLERTWRPLDAGAGASVAGMAGGMALAPAGGGLGTRLVSRVVGDRAGLGAAFAMGSVFAIGWTPCVGVILGGILGLAAASETTLQGGVLLLAYSAGLGVPFIAIAAVYDRAPRILRPLHRHGRLVSLIGGLLVVAIGAAMVLDLLALLPRYFPFTGV